MSITNEQKLICQQTTNFFENETVVFNYGYCEFLGDGRGFTAGFFGACSGTGDLLQVVEEYCKKRNPSSFLCDYLPELRRLAQTESGDVKGLHGFPLRWKVAAATSAMIKAQHHVCDELYWKPSQKYAAKLKVKTVLGAAILYDSIIQHGDGTDEDSIGALIERVPFKINGVNEETWLAAFLKVRHDDLMQPYDHASQKVWKESAPRVTALHKLLDSGNMGLVKPFEVHCFGNTAKFE